MDEAGILVSIVTQESASLCDQPRIPLYMLGIQVTRHEDGKSPDEAGSQVRSN
jgi:hypothetical protein